MAAAVDRISRYDNHRRLEQHKLRELLTYFLSPPSRPHGGCYYIISL